MKRLANRITDLEFVSKAVKHQGGFVLVTFPDGHKEIDGRTVTDSELEDRKRGMHEWEALITLPDNGRGD